jgi:hypothetical protein
MGDHYAVLALRRKRARLAGEIEAIERAEIGRRASLANLDAAILLFENAGDPIHPPYSARQVVPEFGANQTHT